MAEHAAERRSWLTNQVVLPQAPDVAVTALPPQCRLLYRGDPVALGISFGVVLPMLPCGSVVRGERAALWLGPDEWLLLAGEAQAASLPDVLRKSIGASAAMLVDISHRNAGLVVSGAKAALLLRSACPLDLDRASFPEGMVARTIFGKAEIILWRPAADTFRLEVQRSFAPYVAALLGEAVYGL